MIFQIGKLRVPSEIEMKGLDIYKHGEAAYPLYAYGHGWDDYEPLSRKTTRNRVMSFNQESKSIHQLGENIEKAIA